MGRHLVGDVLLRRPVTPCPGQLAVDVALPPSTVPAHALLLEAVRQTALLTAWRAYALKPAHSTLGALRVHFRGYADPELPMRCTAVWDRLGKDADGRRLTPVTLSLVQAGSAVLEATASVGGGPVTGSQPCGRTPLSASLRAATASASSMVVISASRVRPSPAS
ncbi:hypothetical protein QA942_27505 [Streptomyces sp. B21-106]|uniref:hypothetical protein n=1 Tax=Streptomyces sp. B21-106 TaxID=3039418 RepID=UPI002FF2DBC9